MPLQGEDRGNKVYEAGKGKKCQEATKTKKILDFLFSFFF